MLCLSGKVEEIKKDRKPAPLDGVHDMDDEGLIVGARAFTLDGKIMPRGMVGFYYRLDEDSGVKVYYSFKRDLCASKRTVIKCRNNMKALSRTVSLKPGKVVRVKIDFIFGERRIGKICWGILVPHVHFPDKWIRYLHGNAYEWGEGEDTVAGVLGFRKRLKKAVLGLGLKIDHRGKLGDILYCTKRRGWYLVDCG